MSLDRIQSGLLSLYGVEFPSKERKVIDLARISDGWETDVYSFAVEHGADAEQKRDELILRIYPGENATQKAEHEFSTMKQLGEVGYPVPRVLLLEQNSALLGRPFVIMERIIGRSMGVISDESPIERKLELLTQFCRMFADLHTLDWRPFAPDPSLYETRDMSEIVGRQISQWQDTVDAFQISAFDSVFSWLREQLPDVRCGTPSVLHMDYHPYNILMREDGAAFVIDWTSSDISDYRLDLAWTLLLMSTYGSPESAKFVLDEYGRAAGHSIEQIAYFEVVACLRRLFSILISLGAGAEKLGMRPGAEAMMKDVGHIESVYALLREKTRISIPEIDELLLTLHYNDGH